MSMKYKPMLAKIGTKALLEDKNLWFEPKLDGYRALCQVTPKGITLYSRRGINITDQFPELDILKYIKTKNCIIDGEIIVYNKKGFADFKLLQGRSQLTDPTLIAQKSKQSPATYAVFDILSKDSKTVLKLPYIERRKMLHEVVKPSKRIELLRATHDGKKLFAFMKKHHLEGVMAKDPQGIYSPGKRTRAWQKVKLMKSIECVLLGYTQDVKKISSLALGLYKNNKLIYVGRVGTGFSQTNIAELYPKLIKNHSAKATTIMPSIKNMIHLKPTLVGEIQYLEITRTGTLRHSSYLHFRDDKRAKNCTWDQLNS